MVTRRARRWIAWGVTLFVAFVVLGLAGTTWYYSEQIEAGLLAVDPWVPERDLVVRMVTPDRVVLPVTEDTSRTGLWGLEWDGGYAEVGEVVGGDDATVARSLLAVTDGELRPGQSVGWDGYAHAGDPGDLGLQFAEVIIEGPLGDYPAWQIVGEDDTWVIFVHGKGASRREALRALPTVVGMGFPALVVTYRNDVEAPGTGRHALGESEWRDVEAAIEYAEAAGASDVVLVGYSMGGVISAMVLHESEWANLVRALVLDAPLLDVGAVVDHEAAGHKVPGFITGWAKALATLRFGVDWGVLDQVDRADEFEVPILLFHGDEDDTIPIATSRRFAAARPDIVRFEVFPGAGHVESWNVDRDRYEGALREFLSEHVLGPLGRPGGEASDP
jgi:pimeloyl-ACP methyl ester carboxylesterase